MQVPHQVHSGFEPGLLAALSGRAPSLPLVNSLWCSIIAILNFIPRVPAIIPYPQFPGKIRGFPQDRQLTGTPLGTFASCPLQGHALSIHQRALSSHKSCGMMLL
jgi:hypothetical protein